MSQRTKGVIMNEKKTSTDYPIHELLAERWSPYAFDDRPVPEEDLRSLFEAARWAPSSYNEQPWRYIVCTKDDPEQFKRLLSCLVEGKPDLGKSGASACLGRGESEIRAAMPGTIELLSMTLALRLATCYWKRRPGVCLSIK